MGGRRREGGRVRVGCRWARCRFGGGAGGGAGLLLLLLLRGCWRRLGSHLGCGGCLSWLWGWAMGIDVWVRGRSGGGTC